MSLSFRLEPPPAPPPAAQPPPATPPAAPPQTASRGTPLPTPQQVGRDPRPTPLDERLRDRRDGGGGDTRPGPR